MTDLPEIPDEALRVVGEAIEDATLTHLGRGIGTIHRDKIAAAAYAAALRHAADLIGGRDSMGMVTATALYDLADDAASPEAVKEEKGSRADRAT